MADCTCPSLWIILSVCFLVSASEVTDIPTELGQTVILPCRVPNNSPVIATEWTRPHLGEEYVLFYRDGLFEPENQHPSFKDRVELKDKQMKDGDVSVILKNVTKDDNGKYECYVFQSGTNRRKRNIFNTEPIKIINLTVGHTEERRFISPYIGLVSVCVIICVIAAVSYIISRRSKGDTKKNPLHPPTNEAIEQLV